MNEAQFLELWESEKQVYRAWGDHVVCSIKNVLISRGKNINDFLKIPATARLKENASLLDKAFYRPNKLYDNPYYDIEDKVGARFVVLLLADIQEICEIVENSPIWAFDQCKHFDQDREKDPLLFTYQSVHYILRPNTPLSIDDQTIPVTTTCELQVRTLLQHAHAELTHDAIYKAKRAVRPGVHRTVAKSMALIETTDDFFSEVTQKLNYGPLEEFGISKRLDGIYRSLTGLESQPLKSSIVIWDIYENYLDQDLVERIQGFLEQPQYAGLSEVIIRRYTENNLYQQNIVLFLYWMLINRKRRLLQDWPFEKEYLDPLAVDLGISTWDD